MNKIIWKGDRFECNSPELEAAKLGALSINNKRLHEFMDACDLPMDGYSYDADWNICTHRRSQEGKLVFFPIADEGTGFNICFHLGAYAIASMNLGQKLEICAYSFKPLLHPLLFQALGKWFGDRKVEEIDKKCPYFSGSYELKCAVNPSLPCKDCSDASASFKENLFVWRATELRDLDCVLMKHLEDIAMRGGGFESMRQAFVSAGERAPSMVRIPRLNPLIVERIGDRGVSIGFTFDQEAITRLRNAGIPERPFVGVDEGSGQDATAIASGVTRRDGSIYIDTLVISADTLDIQAAIARVRSSAKAAMDRHFREAYQCGLSDRVKLNNKLE